MAPWSHSFILKDRFLWEARFEAGSRGPEYGSPHRNEWGYGVYAQDKRSSRNAFERKDVQFQAPHAPDC